ncbi:MAG: hypothetical protein FWC20_06640 [Oscillospiraceae bacterium]|nr:hypothetical protein [Oscillospiraceae bacterium]MCL2279067.1 hypothetical protein [Oscillospiraceae bacterium]
MADNESLNESQDHDRRSGGRRDDEDGSGIYGGDNNNGIDRRSGSRSKERRDSAGYSHARTDDENLVETVVLYKKEVEKKQNRRKKKDWVTQMSTIMTFVAWVTMLVVWVIMEAASPDVEWAFLAGFGRVHFDMEPVLRQRWDFALVYMSYILLISSIGMSAIALVFNLMRNRRKTDKIKKSVIFTGGLTVIILVIFLFNFWSLLF